LSVSKANLSFYNSPFGVVTLK